MPEGHYFEIVNADTYIDERSKRLPRDDIYPEEQYRLRIRSQELGVFAVDLLCYVTLMDKTSDPYAVGGYVVNLVGKINPNYSISYVIDAENLIQDAKAGSPIKERGYFLTRPTQWGISRRKVVEAVRRVDETANVA